MTALSVNKKLIYGYTTTLFGKLQEQYKIGDKQNDTPKWEWQDTN